MNEESRNRSEQGDEKEKNGAGPAAGAAERGGTGKGEKTEQDLPPINFSTFILSLSTSALMNLGEIENPITKKREKELLAAKQTIDIIALLKEKTQGNLDESESRLIDDVLTDLRLRYVRAAGSS